MTSEKAKALWVALNREYGTSGEMQPGVSMIESALADARRAALVEMAELAEDVRHELGRWSDGYPSQGAEEVRDRIRALLDDAGASCCADVPVGHGCPRCEGER